MCSATIDQIKLRRAMNLPVAFQKVSSSGFHSEIHAGLSLLIPKFPFLVAGRMEARKRVPERPRREWFAGSDDGFRGRQRWRQMKLFKLCASVRESGNCCW